jgi:hypothetical protein
LIVVQGEGGDEPIERRHPQTRADLSYVGIISSDARAGTIPIPQSHWTCRFANVRVDDTVASSSGFFYLSRFIACSHDDWQSIVFNDGPTASGATGGPTTKKTAEMILYEGERAINLSFSSCNPSAPDKDLNDGCWGMSDKSEGDSVTISPGNLTVRVHQLAGDTAK